MNNNKNIDPKQLSGLEYKREFSLFGITSVLFTLIIYAICNVIPFFIYASSANSPEILKKYDILFIAGNLIMTITIPFALILTRKIEYKIKGFNILGNKEFIVWIVFYCLFCIWASKPIPIEKCIDHSKYTPGIITAIKFLFTSTT